MVSEHYIIKNLQNGKTISNLQHATSECSSLIKVPLVLMTLRTIEEQGDNLSLVLQVKNYHISNGSGIISWLKKRKFTIIELIKNVFLYSDCTATNVLIDYCGGPMVVQEYISGNSVNSSLDCSYINFVDRTDNAVGTSCPNDMINFIESLHSKLKNYSQLERLVSEWSKKSNTWFASFLPDNVEPVIIKTGSMYHTGNGLEYVMNVAAILKNTDDKSLYSLSQFSYGSFLDSSAEAEVAAKESAAYRILMYMGKL